MDTVFAADGKRLAMLPESLYLRGEGNHLRLVDASGIQVKTKQKLELRADGLISIHAQNRVEFKTPEQLRLVKTGVNSGMNVVGGQMHMKSETVRFVGDPDKPMTEQLISKKQASQSIDFKLALSVLGMIPKK